MPAAILGARNPLFTVVIDPEFKLMLRLSDRC